MAATDKIWYELVNVKYGEVYLSEYLSFQRTLKKYSKIATLILSVNGILGWKFFEDYAWIAFLLIAVLQLFTLIENELIRTDKEIEDIGELKLSYTRYFNKLERTWTHWYMGRITEEEALDNYFELRQSDWENIESLDGKLNIKKLKRLEKIADIEANRYLTNYH